jgi:hypothetical protein
VAERNPSALDLVEEAQRLAALHRSDGAHFVFAELANGLAICLSLRLNQPSNANERYWNIARAQIALEVTEACMWELKLSHYDFNQMMAFAERLRFEVGDLSSL